jgi:formylglycine-generating enzyme required for sulfatase activity
MPGGVVTAGQGSRPKAQGQTAELVSARGPTPNVWVAIVLIVAFAVTGMYAQRPAPARAVGIAWARIPSGTFQMGCVPGDPRCSSDEQPRHAVTISRPFDLMTTEVTVGMFRSHGFEVDEQPVWSRSENHPVVVVTWTEANDFCAKIGGRLPTEAEWEHAARGGKDGFLYPWGDQAPTDAAAAVNGAAFEGDAAQPVGQYAPNAFGVYDMAGNVWEWVSDWAGTYGADAASDPKGSVSGRVRLVRGGSYGDDPSNLRVSNRTPNAPDRINLNVGFRCARDVR